MEPELRVWNLVWWAPLPDDKGWVLQSEGCESSADALRRLASRLPEVHQARCDCVSYRMPSRREIDRQTVWVWNVSLGPILDMRR